LETLQALGLFPIQFIPEAFCTYGATNQDFNLFALPLETLQALGLFPIQSLKM
jgi:hypothetical protein